jgi:hypothetical protein
LGHRAISVTLQHALRRNCPTFIEASPKFAVQHTLAAVTPPTLQAKVINDLEYEKATLNYLFIRHLIKEAIAYEPYISLSTVSKGSSGGDGGARVGGSGGSSGAISSGNGGSGFAGGGSGVVNGARAGGSGGSGSFGSSDGSN